MKNFIKIEQYGLDVIFRHDYDDKKDEINNYVSKSLKDLDSFISNVPNKDKFKSFLDVGCGNDYTLNILKDRYLCSGIDLYPAVKNKNIHIQDFHNMSNYFKEKFDIVFCNHTLEHSGEPPKLLHQINLIQNLGGILFIAVPDGETEWSYNITQSTTHWNIFTKPFLTSLVQRFGYEVCVETREFREGKKELFLFGIKRWNLKK